MKLLTVNKITNMYAKQYELNGYILKSFLEYYFALWLNELIEAGYVVKWAYEETTFPLFEGLYLPYRKQLKTKIKDDTFHVFNKASYTEDFTIYWGEKAENIFYINSNKPISGNIYSIPFILSDYANLVSHVDVKSTNKSTTSSSVSYPYKAKWVYDKYKVIIHLVYPFSPNKKDYKKTLFYNTFYPQIVIDSEVYIRDCKYGKKGQSKIKHRVRTINEYLREL